MIRRLAWTSAFRSTPPFPPDGSPKLITITISHYVEKVRWGLDLSPHRLTYIEDNHVAPFHVGAVVAYTKDPTKTMTPTLVYPDGRALQDSSEILLHLSRTFPKEMGHLYPPGMEKEILAMEASLSSGLGVEVRLLAYEYLINQLPPSVMAEKIAYEAPLIERLLAKAVLPMVQEAICRMYNVNEATAAAGKEVVRKAFAQVSELLGKDGGRRYILGTPRMTAVDITFAALASPLLDVPEKMAMVPKELTVLPDYAALRDELRATPAGQFVLRMYKEERYLDGPSALRIRNTRRDRLPWAGLLASAVVVAGAWWIGRHKSRWLS